MKKIIIIILIYSIISVIFLSIMSIPPKIKQEEADAKIQQVVDSMREIAEEHWPDMPEEIIENALSTNENIVRDSYEKSNTFSFSFINNLIAYFIGLAIVIVIAILRRAHLYELYGKWNKNDRKEE